MIHQALENWSCRAKHAVTLSVRPGQSQVYEPFLKFVAFPSALLEVVCLH